MPVRVAINGFGRIGRASYRIALDKPEIEIVAINDLTNPRILAHLLKYDSTYGRFNGKIQIEENGKLVSLEDTDGDQEAFFAVVSEGENYLVINDKKVRVTAQKDPALLPWKDLNVDVVLECTGRFTKDDSASAHIKAGAKKVIVSGPVKGGTTQTFLLGVNDDQYLGQNTISMASCTTNCISPVIRAIHNEFGVVKSLMTTVHSLTMEQTIIDGPPPPLHPDMRRARTASFNMIPTTSGAAKATTLAMPDLKGKFDGIAVRVPLISQSLSDITMVISIKAKVEDINNALVKACQDPKYKNVMTYTFEPIVSSDIVKSPFSAICDLSMTKVVDGDLVKVLAWYDNEWGYSNRLVEMAIEVTK